MSYIKPEIQLNTNYTLLSVKVEGSYGYLEIKVGESYE